jgi:Growth-Arrest-Specific Protein 2 Domain
MVLQLIVRVGGGYLSLEEFLNQHVPIELEKMSRNHPVNILSKNIGNSLNSWLTPAFFQGNSGPKNSGWKSRERKRKEKRHFIVQI